jgi:hypothetical protein
MLKTVQIETRLGAIYIFPDVAEDIRFPSGSGLDANVTSLTITNMSGACLVVPYRIVKKVRFDDAVVWEGPS